MVEIDDDVQGVANGLAAIDPHIRLRFSEAGEHFVVYWQESEDDGYLIFTAQDLDQRVVKRMEEVYHRCQQPGYSFADELEKTEAKVKADADYALLQKHGPIYERMAHAMRKDTGYDKQQIFVPGGTA